LITYGHFIIAHFSAVPCISVLQTPAGAQNTFHISRLWDH